MRFYLLLAGLLLAITAAQAQKKDSARDTIRVEGPVSTFAEQMPRFKADSSSMEALMRYLGQNIRYPGAALRDRVEGRVYVQFVVTKTGEVARVRVVRSVHPALDAEGIRVIAAMPRWEVPGRQAGQPVNVALSLPVTFKIDSAPSNREKAEALKAGQASARTWHVANNTVARFPGGPKALVHYLTPRPPAGQPDQAVFVRFVVDAEGAVAEAQALSPPSAEIGKAATQWVRQMPRWQPAHLQGKATRSEWTLPVIFSAQPADTTAAIPLPYADVPPALGLRQSPTPDLRLEVSRHLKYPAEALRQQITGQVLVFFVVNELGYIEQLQALQAAHPLLETAALQAVASLKLSAPPMHADQPVRVYYTLPLEFNIR